MGSAQFHLLASLFGVEVRLHGDSPDVQILQLRSIGLSVAEIARQTETSPTVVRRIVGKLDPQAAADRRRTQVEIARCIKSEPLTWFQKVKRWKEETGQSEATFRRVLRRCGNPML
jgi:hypothetical protein